MSFLTNYRLRSVSDQLKRARDDLAVTREQLEQLTDEADLAQTRAIVSDDPFAAGESNDSQRHATALRRHYDELLEKISSLEAKSDALLDQLSSK